MKIKKPFSLILFFILIFPLGAQSFGSLPEDRVELKALFDRDDKDQIIVALTYFIPEGLHQIEDRDFFKITLEGDDWELKELIYPEPEDFGDFKGWEKEVTLKALISFKGKSSFLENLKEFPVTAHYQLCDDRGICLRPEKELVTAYLSEGLIEQNSTLLKQKKGTALFLLFAFLGGIILNIMPCILPVLYLKAINLVQQGGSDKKSILLNSFSYAGGILFSMLVLGALVMGIKASGTLLGWGFQFQNTSFVLILTSLVLLFGLSLFEVFFINPPQGAGELARKQSSRGYLGSFVTGIMAVLLSTPCTAPLLGSALGFAFSQSGVIILVFFALIGLGLAFPFILLGFFPALINRLPKPGEWMNRFREIMGFLLFGTVIYLLSVLHGQLGSGFKGIMWFLLVLSFSAWLYGRSQRSGLRKKRIFLMVLALLSAGVGGAVFIDMTPAQKIRGTDLFAGEEKVIFSPQQVEQYRKEGQALFLEFTADWCATCRTNHIMVLDRDFRRDLFERNNIVYMVGDYTRNDPIITQWLSDYKRAGVPLYIYYAPGKEPLVLPEILTRAILEKAIDS